MTYTLCRLVIYFDDTEVLSFVFGVCVCILFYGQNGSVVLHRTQRCLLSLRLQLQTEYMCSAGVAHILPLVGEALAESSAQVELEEKDMSQLVGSIHATFVCMSAVIYVCIYLQWWKGCGWRLVVCGLRGQSKLAFWGLWAKATEVHKINKTLSKG